MPRYKLILEYLGTNFSGWQKQKNSCSIQETLEMAAYDLLQEKINLVVAGRTDSGVHAEGQVAHFDLQKKFCCRKIQLGINFHLIRTKFGKDISVKKVTKVNENFNARFSAKKKLYQYLIYNSVYRSPLLYDKSWWVRQRLDCKKMLDASHYLLGSHNFSSFRSKGCQSSSPIKTLENIKVSKYKNIVRLNFVAKSFLYKQVRIMVGTLKDVGTGLTSVEDMKTIINKENRKCAGITAPSKGLILKKVSY